MFGLLALVSGCGTVTSHSRTQEYVHVELRPRDYELVKYVEAKDCVGRYFFFFKFFTPNPLEAAKKAMQDAPQANWLVNRHVTLQEEIYVPLIYHRQCLLVEGEAVKIYGTEDKES